jgi:hypothetical protein
VISEGEWASIRALVEKVSTQVTGGRRNFISDKVVKRDVTKKLVWLSQFGNQPIPIVGFDYEVKYYDTNSSGTVNPKKTTISPAVPDVGDTVLVVLEMGEQSLPRCLGKIQGRNWVLPENERRT